MVLPEPGLPDEGDDLAAAYGQVGAVEGARHRPGPGGEVDLHAAGLDERLLLGGDLGGDLGGAHGSPTRMQAAARWPSSSSRAGSASRHLSTTRGHRGAKEQPGRQLARVGRVAGQSGGCIAGGRVTDAREGAGESACVGMLRVAEDLLGAARLHDAAGVHHQHAVADVGEHRQVVADDHHADAEVAHESGEQVEDLRLDHDVERGRGFVGDDQRGSAGQGHRDHHPLALPAGELVGVGTHPGRREADLLEQLTDPLLDRVVAHARARAPGSPRRSAARRGAPG